MKLHICNFQILILNHIGLYIPCQKKETCFFFYQHFLQGFELTLNSALQVIIFLGFEIFLNFDNPQLSGRAFGFGLTRANSIGDWSGSKLLESNFVLRLRVRV